jgi:signal transduction histidine kinase
MGMSILEYILAGSFLVLLFLYILKIVITNRFRTNTIEYLKNQKSQIKSLEKEKDDILDKLRAIKSEKVEFQNKIKKQSREYQKIGLILEKGIETQSKEMTQILNKSIGSKSISKSEKDKMKTELQTFGNHINNMISWYQSVYGENNPEVSSFEIVEITQNVINDVSAVLSYKNLTFINHIGEPINVSADQNMISYATSTIATLLGIRSVSGNTMYVDVERTGKKCLISFEDTGPGDMDDVIKDLAGEKFDDKNLEDLKDFAYLSLIMAKDLIEKNGGKLWVSSIMDVGIKISYSIPLD